jgi:hypothetical protein
LKRREKGMRWKEKEIRSPNQQRRMRMKLMVYRVMRVERVKDPGRRAQSK